MYMHVYRLSSFQRNRQHDDTDDASLCPGPRANCQRVDRDSTEAGQLLFLQQILGGIQGKRDP